jgi:sucrose-phosphate synthase
VVELAKALARIPSVARVDLLTRLIRDPTVDKSYGEPEERLVLPPMGPLRADPGQEGDMTGAFIVRLPCGPTDVYLRCWMEGTASKHALTC